MKKSAVPLSPSDASLQAISFVNMLPTPLQFVDTAVAFGEIRSRRGSALSVSMTYRENCAWHMTHNGCRGATAEFSLGRSGGGVRQAGRLPAPSHAPAAFRSVLAVLLVEDSNGWASGHAAFSAYLRPTAVTSDRAAGTLLALSCLAAGREECTCTRLQCSAVQNTQVEPSKTAVQSNCKASWGKQGAWRLPSPLAVRRWGEGCTCQDAHCAVPRRSGGKAPACCGKWFCRFRSSGTSG